MKLIPGDLDVDSRCHTIRACPIKITAFQNSIAIWHDSGADVCVGLAGLAEGSIDRVVDVGAGARAGAPARCNGPVAARVDLIDQYVGPGLCIGHAMAANEGLRHLRIPDFV
jgi:hypothetical protein